MKFRFACALAVTSVAIVYAMPARATSPCSAPRYAYAGLVGTPGNQYGITATLSAIQLPVVEDGHVAAWVGVGGPREGPGGTPEWLQVGLNSGQRRGNHLYDEYATPGTGVTYGGEASRRCVAPLREREDSSGCRQPRYRLDCRVQRHR